MGRSDTPVHSPSVRGRPPPIEGVSGPASEDQLGWGSGADKPTIGEKRFAHHEDAIIVQLCAEAAEFATMTRDWDRWATAVKPTAKLAYQRYISESAGWGGIWGTLPRLIGDLYSIEREPWTVRPQAGEARIAIQYHNACFQSLLSDRNHVVAEMVRQYPTLGETTPDRPRLIVPDRAYRTLTMVPDDGTTTVNRTPTVVATEVSTITRAPLMAPNPRDLPINLRSDPVTGPTPIQVLVRKPTTEPSRCQPAEGETGAPNSGVTGGVSSDPPRDLSERRDMRSVVRGETAVGETQTPERSMRVMYNEDANRAYLSPVRGDDFRPANMDPAFLRFNPPPAPSPSVPREKQFNDGFPWFELDVKGGGKSSVGRHLLVKAINEASQGRMPLVFGPPVYVQANGIQTPEQLGKSKNPEVQVAAVEAAYLAVEQYGTPTTKLQAFQALAELLRALHGLLEYTPTQRIKFCHDEPMMFLIRRALNTIPLSPPAVLLKTLEGRRELKTGYPPSELPGRPFMPQDNSGGRDGSTIPKRTGKVRAKSWSIGPQLWG